uniref:Uncharacterized protein n=1 Tax=Nicotiana tabacum TaxID=4097 RepID=A0A1S4CD76_TOBAC|nr:PREDICTED: uncharacterized protein LOC107817751 [Nicotiana tabacum]
MFYRNPSADMLLTPDELNLEVIRPMASIKSKSPTNPKAPKDPKAAKARKAANAPKDPKAAKARKAANAPKDPKAPKQRIITTCPSVPAAPPIKPGDKYYEFGDWFNRHGYWKGNHDLKSLITSFLTLAQQDKLNNGTFRYIMAMENFKCSMKLVHYLCLSRIFTNDRDSISFKIFGHDVSFTLEDFHIMCGLRITTHNVEKPINRESNILKRYFGKSNGTTLKDI